MTKPPEEINTVHDVCVVSLAREPIMMPSRRDQAHRIAKSGDLGDASARDG